MKTPLTDKLRESDNGDTYPILDSHEELERENARLREQLTRWETEISNVMPPDCKDWWQNSKTEWPMIARMTIENLQEREKSAWDILSNAQGEARVPEEKL